MLVHAKFISKGESLLLYTQGYHSRKNKWKPFKAKGSPQQGLKLTSRALQVSWPWSNCSGPRQS